MRSSVIWIGLAAVLVCVSAAPAQARARRPRGRRGTVIPPPSEEGARQRNIVPEIEWLTDFDEAAALAGRENRPLMVLFTTVQAARSSRSCRFTANSVRRAVHDARVVPVRILPPVPLQTRGVPEEDAAERRELNEKAQERHRALVGRFRVGTVPSLVFAAPDAAPLTTLAVPTDERIRSTLGQMARILEWRTDLDEAVALAGRENRPLMILFTTAQAARSSQSCRFAAESVWRAMHDAGVVPVRILPPVPLQTRGLPEEEAAERRALNEKAQEKHRALVKRFGVGTFPSLVLAAPDAAPLTTLVLPTDERIRSTLGQTARMLEAHQKVAGRGGAGTAQADGGKAEAGVSDAGKPKAESEKKGDPNAEVDEEDLLDF